MFQRPVNEESEGDLATMTEMFIEQSKKNLVVRVIERVPVDEC